MDEYWYLVEVRARTDESGWLDLDTERFTVRAGSEYRADKKVREHFAIKHPEWVIEDIKVHEVIT